MLINLELLIDSYTNVREQYATTFLTKQIDLGVLPRVDETIVLDEAYVNVAAILHRPLQPPVLICNLFLEDGSEPVLEIAELEHIILSLQDSEWVLMEDEEKPSLPAKKFH